MSDVLATQRWQTNAHLLADAARLGYGTAVSGERYEQVGVEIDGDWFTLEEIGERMPFATPPGTTVRALYVKVPDPDPKRCPTCGSDNPAVRIVAKHYKAASAFACTHSFHDAVLDKGEPK